jgi:hypothetical protein
MQKDVCFSENTPIFKTHFFAPLFVKEQIVRLVEAILFLAQLFKI